MSKKLFIIGLIFLILGLTGLGWTLRNQQRDKHLLQLYRSQMATEVDDFTKSYQQWLMLPDSERSELPWQLDEAGKQKTQQQLQKEREIRLFIDLDKLVENRPTDKILAEALYGAGWEKKIEEYKSRKMAEKLVLAGSVLSGGSGALFVFWWILAVITWGISRCAKNKSAKKQDKKKVEEKTVKAQENEPKEIQADIQTKSLSVLLKSDDEDTSDSAQSENKKEKVAQSIKANSVPVTKISFERLYTDEDSAKKQEEQVQTSHLSLAEAIKKRLHSSEEKVQTSQLFNVDKIITHKFEKLTEEIAAIRRYASEQQERIKKLQDGYDWNIIKNFCMRIIRCIDNLETRIKALKKNNIGVKELEEIKDELLFSLESSGVERFGPEVNSEYKGQERAVEAIRDKDNTGGSEKAGKIAEVLKYGYRYCLDDDNYKVIRPAQVKIYN